MSATHESQPFVSTGPQGHRGRMRMRLLAGETALADYEILEMLLFLGVPRRDTKPLAKALVNRFGDLRSALSAPTESLAQAGVPPRAMEAFAAVLDAAEQLSRPEPLDRPTLDSWTALDRHFRTAAAAPGYAALLLNNRNQLLAAPTWSDDTGPAQLGRETLRRALQEHASAVILVRQDPAPEPMVQPQDFALHTHLVRAAEPLSIVVHDMIVRGSESWISLRQRLDP